MANKVVGICRCPECTYEWEITDVEVGIIGMCPRCGYPQIGYMLKEE